MGRPETRKIGTVTFLVNVPKEDDVSDEALGEIGQIVRREFEERRATRPVLADGLVVQNVSTERGCILVTLSLGVIVGGALSFLKNYKAIREGVILLSQDLEGIFVRSRGWFGSGRVTYYREDLNDEPGDPPEAKAA